MICMCKDENLRYQDIETSDSLKQTNRPNIARDRLYCSLQIGSFDRKVVLSGPQVVQGYQLFSLARGLILVLLVISPRCESMGVTTTSARIRSS